MLKPSLIAFEGGECAGKSTVIASLKKWIEDHGQECIIVKVPGETPPGKQIRQIVVGEHHRVMSKTVNALLYCADWVHTLETVVNPAIERGAVVLADRSNVTMYAYQHETPNLKTLMGFADAVRKIDRVIVISTLYATYLERLQGRDVSSNNDRDYIDQETFDQYYHNYQQYREEHPNTTRWVCGEHSPEEILLAVKYAIEPLSTYSSERD